MDARTSIRVARPGDLGAVDRLLSRSYPALLAPDYSPSVLATVIPRMARAQPALLASGNYRVAEAGGAIVAAGGWTRAAPGRERARPGHGHVRHLATDPDWTRRGLARAILEESLAEARAEGLVALDCLSTRSAVPFYAAMGFRGAREVEVEFAPGIAFPAVRMMRRL